MYMNKDLLGDGRRRIDPPPWSAATCVPMTLGQIKTVVKVFKIRGYSYHSRNGSTMWVLKEWARLNGRMLYQHLGTNGGFSTYDFQEYKKFRKGTTS